MVSQANTELPELQATANLAPPVTVSLEPLLTVSPRATRVSLKPGTRSNRAIRRSLATPRPPPAIPERPRALECPAPLLQAEA
jgi:hypothetical protein